MPELLADLLAGSSRGSSFLRDKNCGRSGAKECSFQIFCVFGGVHGVVSRAFSTSAPKVQRNVILIIDLVKSFLPTNVWWRKLASIPPRTSPLKFAKREFDSYKTPAY